MKTPCRSLATSIASLVPVLTLLAAVPSAHATSGTKASNNTALNVATSWTGSNLPTLGEIGTFDSTSGTNGVGLTADYSIGEILIGTITANQTFNASPGFALTLGGVAGVGIDMSSVSNGTNSLTNNLTTFLGGSQSWSVAASRTLTQAGRLDLASATLTLPGAGTTTISGRITGSGGIAKTLGAGTLTLSYAGNATSPSSFSGGITLGAGGLTISGVNAGGSGLISATAGTVTISAAQLLLSGGLTIGGSSSASLSATNAGGTGTVSVNTSGTFTTTTAAALQNNTVSLTAAGTLTLAASSSIGALTGSLGFTPTTALTLGFNNASPVAYTGAIAGSATLTKIGSGTQVLNGLNSSTGTITVNGAGGTLEFGGASNVSNGSVNVNAGTLKLNFNTVGAGTTDLLKATSALTLGGGTLLIQGKDSATTAAQTFVSTTVTPGTSSNVRVNSGTGVSTAFVNLGAITRVNNFTNSGTINFTLPSGTPSATNGILTSSGTAGSMLLSTGANPVAYATVAGTNWAVKDASNTYIEALSSYTIATATSLGTAPDNSNIASGIDTTVAATTTINTIRFNENEGRTLSIAAGQFLTVTAGGILVTGNVATAGSKITGGSIRPGGGSGTELIIHQYSSQPFTLDSVITDFAGSTGLLKAGSGTLILTKANLNSGFTWVNDGTLQMGAGGSLASSSVILAPNNTSAVFDVNNQTVSVANLSGGGSGATGGRVNLGNSGVLTLVNPAGSTFSGSLVGGPASVINKNGAGLQGLQSSSSLAFYGTFNLNVGSLGLFNGTPALLNTNLVMTSGTSVNHGGFASTQGFGNISGSGTIGGGTSNNTGAPITNFGYLGGSATFSGAITDGANATPNPLMAIGKFGSGTATLSGVNTYGGATTAFSGNLVLDYSTGSDVIGAATPGALTLSGGTLTYKGGTGAALNADTTGAFGLSGNMPSRLVLDSNGGVGYTLTLATTIATTVTLASSSANNVALFDTSSSAGNVLKTNNVLAAADTNANAIRVSNGLLATGGTSLNNYRADVLIKDSAGYGFATRDGSNNIVRYTSATPLVVGTDEGTTLLETTNYKLSANLSRTVQFLYNTLELDSSGSAVTLTVNTTAFSRFGNSGASVSGRGILITGTNGATITGAGGANSGGFNQPTYFNNYLTGGTVAGQTFTLDIDSLGAIFTNGTGLTVASRNVTGDVYLGSGVFRQTFAQAGGDAVVGGTNVYRLIGGVLEIGADLTGSTSSTSTADFSRSPGSSAGQVLLMNDTGFSAFTNGAGGSHTVNLGGSGVTVNWGQDNFLVNSAGNETNATFKLSSAYADATIEFQNGLNLNAFNRTIDVANGSALVDARLTGVISNSNAVANTIGSVTKTGSGALELTAANTYNGSTTINAGTLRLAGGSAIPDGSAVSLANNATAVLDLNGVGETIGSLAGGGVVGGNVTLGAGTLTSGGDNTSTAFAGIISGTGSGSLVKTGTGALVLTGGNTYGGGTTISAGSLQLGNGGTTGSLLASSAILDNGNLTINRSNAVAQGTDFSGAAITGTGSFIQAGSGTTTLTAANSYDGVTTISKGILAISNNNALGSTVGGTEINVTSSTATRGKLSLSGGITVGDNITLQGSGLAANEGSITATSGVNTLTGTVTFTGNNGYRLDASGAGTVLNYNGPILDTSAGATQLYVSGATTNFNAAIDTNGGSFFAHGAVSLNATGSDIGDTFVQYNGTLKIGITDALPSAKNLQIGLNGLINATGADVGTFDLRGFNQTVNSLNGYASTGTAAPTTSRTITNSVIATTSTLTIGSNGGSGSFDGLIQNGAGTVALTKTGSGTEALKGGNTHSGTTLVSGGTLALENVNALQLSTLDTGASGAQSVTFTVPGTNTYSLGGLKGADDLDIGANTVLVGANNQSTAYNGALSGVGGSVTKIGSGVFSLNGAQSYTTLTTFGGVTNVNGSFTGGTSTVNANATTNFYASQTLAALVIGNGVEVTFGNGLPLVSEPEKFGAAALVPEPGSLGLLLVGSLGLLARRRRV